LAILAALQYIDITQRTDRKITIYTDSKVTRDKVQNSNIHINKLQEIRRKINEINKTSGEVTLCWVKAHAVILGKKVAVTLAKKVATNESLT